MGVGVLLDEERLEEGLGDGGERGRSELRGEGEGGGDAGGADGRVRIAEAADDGGEDFREVRGEGVPVVIGEDGDEADALTADGGLVGGVGGRDGGYEGGEGVGGERPGDGLQLRRGGGVGVPIGELVEAREHPVLEVTCLRLRLFAT